MSKIITAPSIPCTLCLVALSAAACKSVVAQEGQPARVTTNPIEHVIEVRDPKNVIGTIVETPPAEIKTADDLLRALEHADKGLQSLQAGVLYDRVAEALGDRQIRKGSLAFQTDDAAASSPPPTTPPRRRFAVHFTTLQTGTTEYPKDQQLIFDGEWFIEKLVAEKQFKKRQVVPAGQVVDPLKIGEGPFPIPIGQKREEILKRYAAQLLPPTAELVAQENDDKEQQKAEQVRLEDFVTNVTSTVTDPVTGERKQVKTPATFYQLKLSLRPEFKDDESLREVRLWYRELSASEGAGGADKHERMLLPRLARTVNRAGDVSIVQLINVVVNKPINPAMMDTTPPSEAGWEITVEPLEEAPAAPATPATDPRK